MTYQSIAVIGLGTLGGFISESISTLEGTEKLIIIDHDIVEAENLNDTVYRQIDIGLLKTDALFDILSSRSDIGIEKISEKFVEDQKEIPNCDLVLDCRNYTYDRMGIIDARLYISSRYLIVDCRKKVSYTSRQKGKYLTKLTKDDLRSASYIVSMLINGNILPSLIKEQAVQKYDLDCFNKRDDTCYDIVYENSLGGDKFVNLPETIVPMINLNKTEDLNVIVGNRENPNLQTIIPRASLKSSSDVILSLSSLTNLQSEFNHYIIAVFKDQNTTIVELIPETGAA